jgi:NAD+ synthase (glutamine-hydrolysing)
MKIALCQINSTVGAIDLNKNKILDFYEKAIAENSDIVVFPELSITGYPPQDLLLDKEFIASNNSAINTLARASSIPLIVGYVRSENKQIFNSAALCKNGKIVNNYDKILLPTYDIFDENRYFTQGKSPSVWSIQSNGKTVNIGIQICEDLWDDDYDEKVSFVQKQKGADFLINISASPFREKKFNDRVNQINQKVKELKIPFLYCNLVGAQDELVFDGSSFAIDKKGACFAYSESFLEDILYVDLNTKSRIKIKYKSKYEDYFNALTLGIKDYFSKTNNFEALIGLSGGIDSAVVASLACNALGKAAVFGVSMPSKFSSDHSKTDAKLLANNLGIDYKTIPIQKLVEGFENSLIDFFSGTDRGIAEENIQSRVRGNLLMALSNKYGRLVLSTGNKTELALGYCTLYGDMSGGLSVISDLNKSEVYELAKWINKNKGNCIPISTIEKPPSAELSPNQVDPFDYDVISPLVDLIVQKRYSNSELINKGFEESIIIEIKNKINFNEYKRRQAPIGIRVSKKAFGFGRRFPIVNHFKED